jgi:hypothetical protein
LRVVNPILIFNKTLMDVIVLIFLAIEIGKLATIKGVSSRRWISILVLSWITGELVGGLIGVSIFGKENMFSWLLVAWGVALTAYFVVKNHLVKMVDV